MCESCWGWASSPHPPAPPAATPLWPVGGGLSPEGVGPKTAAMATAAVCNRRLCLRTLSFSEDGMEVMERLIYLFRKFHQLKISNEEYACMKTINFLNQGECV